MAGMFWRVYGARRFTGSYQKGEWVFDNWSGFTFQAGIHPGRPGEALRAPNPGANISYGECTIYTNQNLRIANETGEGDYIRWEGRWWRVNEEERHGILIPHQRYIAILSDLPIEDDSNLVDVFATIRGLGSVQGVGQWKAGKEIELVAVPSSDWYFVSWNIPGESAIITTPILTLVVPERGITVICTFARGVGPEPPPPDEWPFTMDENGEATLFLNENTDDNVFTTLIDS